MIGSTIRILSSSIESNWFSFHQIYDSILSEKAKRLYIQCFYQKSINERLKIERYSFSLLLKNLKIDEDDFESSLQELIDIGLAKKKVKLIGGSEREILVSLRGISTLKEELKDKNLKSRLKGSVSEEKYSELKMIVGESDFDAEFNYPEETKEEEVLDKKTYFNFYNGVFRRLGCEFTISDEVSLIISSVKDKFSMDELHDLAYRSVQESKGKYFVSKNNLQFLIDQKLNGSKNEKFDVDDYDDFWKGLLERPKAKTKETFISLFSTYECEALYRKLLNKQDIPDSIHKCIRDCIQNKNLSFPIVNASISYIKTLLGKIPAKYLSKFSDTLFRNGYTDFESFINHTRDLLVHESKNKDRLNINREREVRKNDFVFRL
ncbi:putative replication initiation and membrane attachment protein, DnaB2 [Mycoplasma haemofelis Ohio2]|uniref:Putative replication initiation and membrane attachment protein, DnaB2 n=1 Tax=Mycoplasma haemofelis (strain Ohio2) TaxID=859194 RepID=F6FHS7_MYCHI|nr:putative replication initiation and membrane attachment protein, DnaB2 [Mycoplasma haemofelis Ohio2]